MPRQQGLRPIGDSIKKIIERIKKEREERRKKGKPIRTQPKLPGMMSGGMGIFSKRKRVEAGEPDPKGKNKSDTVKDNLTKKKKRLEELKRELGMKRGGMKDPSKAIRSVKPTLGRKKTEEFLRKLKDKKKKMGGGMLKYKKGGFPDLSGDGKTTMKDILIGRGVIKKKKGGMLDKNVRVIDLQKQGKTSKKGIRVKGKGKSFMDVYKKTVYNRADGGMVPFGGEKRVPGSGAATRGTGFKGIF